MSLRSVLAGVCMTLAWLFPLAPQPVPDTFRQLWVVTLLTTAALLLRPELASRKVAVFFGICFLVMLTSPAAYASSTLMGVCGLLLAYLGSACGAGLRQRRQALICFLIAVLAAAVINAAEGLLQWLGLTGGLSPWVPSTDHVGMAFGAFRQRNLFATALVLGLICCAALLGLRRLTVGFSLFLAAILHLGLAASGSRTGGVELLMVAIVGLACWRRLATGERWFWAVQLPMYLMASMVLPLIGELHGIEAGSALNRLSQTGQDGRLLIWKNALELALLKPWTGWGWGEFAYAHYTAVSGARFNELLAHAHNLPLHLMVEFGIPASVLIMAAFAWIFIRPAPRPTAAAPRDGNALHFGMMLVAIVGVHSMLEFPLWYGEFLFLVGVALGYLSPGAEAARTGTVARGWCWLRWTPHLQAVALLCVAAGIALDYQRIRPIATAPFGDGVALRRAIDAAGDAWFFRPYLEGAQLSGMAVTPNTAKPVMAKASHLQHAQPEPFVAIPLIKSAWYLGDTAGFERQAALLCRAYPLAYRRFAGAPDDMAMKQSLPGCNG